MKPKMVVHIGTPKTGTTSIQRALFDERMRMQTECNMVFATTERGTKRGRHVSVSTAALASPGEIENEQRAIVDDFRRSGAGAIFISDEGLGGPQARLAKFFEYFTTDFDVQVICYLRRQDYYAESLYNQAMRGRQFRNMPAITEFWRDNNIAARFEYHKILKGWSEIGATVIAKDFRKEVKELGLLESFQGVAGLKALGELKTRDDNLSQDLRLQLTLCMLYTGIVPEDLGNLTRAVFRAGQTLVNSGAFKQLKNSLGRSERNAVLAQYAENNAALARDYGVDFSDERPEEADEPMLYPDGAYLLALMGELSQVDAIQFYRCAQSYLIARLGALPKQRLIREETKVPPASFENFDANGDVPAELLAIEQGR